MSIYIVDWGEKCNGARYALVEAENIQHAWFVVDSVGEPARIAPLRVKQEYDDDPRYIEIAEPERIYSGPKLSEAKFNWKTVEEAYDYHA